jgi:branched-chain amino acid transport system ATP-binding protein
VTLFEANDLRVGYGDLVAVRDVSFTVDAGKVIALLGRNGAGKTTTLRGISGLNASSPHSLTLDGVDISTLPVHKRAELGIAFVQEGKRVFRQRSVEDNLVMGGYPLHLSRRKLADRLDEAYSRFPMLAERRTLRAGAMSGGQQQMLAIATALVAAPRLIMLDEPSAGLAPTIVADVLAVIRSVKENGMAVVLVEQAVEFALAVADDVAVMDLGRIVYRGAADDPGIRASVHDAYMSRTVTDLS